MSKWIQKKVDRQINSVEDRKDENYREISNMYFPETKVKPRKFFRIVSAVSAAFIAIFIVSVCVIFNNSPAVTPAPTPTEPKYYYADDEVVVDSNTEEALLQAVAFDFNFNVFDEVSVRRAYDKVSSDTLRFFIDGQKENADIQIMFISNPDFEYTYDDRVYDMSTQFQKDDVRYTKMYTSYQLKMSCLVESRGQKIFVSYNNRSMDGSEEPFWSFMNDFITVK